MRIGRRTFILSMGLAAATPAFASLFAVSRAWASPPTSPQNSLAFKIVGWSTRDFVSTDVAPPAEEVWISVNRSWRTAWR
jgi:hypothetical protein